MTAPPAPVAALVSLGRMTAISAAAVARSRTLGEARWSPGGARLAWLDAFGGRVDLVVAAADGSDARGHPHRRGPGDPARGVRRRRVLLGGRRHAGLRGRRRPPRRHRRRRRWAARCSRATAAPPRRPSPPVGTASRSCSSATTPATSPWSPSTAPTGRGGSRTPTTRGIPPGRPTAPAWPGTSGTSRTCRGTGRASCASRPTARRTPRCVAGGDDVAVGQPRFSPTDDTLAFVVGSRRVDERVARRPVTAARPSALVDDAHEHADPSWGPGPAVVRVVARRRRHRAQPQRGRLRPPGASSTSPTGARSTSRAGWHAGLDWGPAGVACIRSGARTAPQLTVLDPRTGARTRPGPRRPRRARRRRPARAHPGDVVGRRRRAGARAAVASARRRRRRRPRATARCPPLLVDVHGGPTDQSTVDWKPRVRYFVSRGWAVLHPNYRGSTGYGAGYRHALDHEWGVLDVADTVAGIRAAGAEGWADASRASR